MGGNAAKRKEKNGKKFKLGFAREGRKGGMKGRKGTKSRERKGKGKEGKVSCYHGKGEERNGREKIEN